MLKIMHTPRLFCVTPKIGHLHGRVLVLVSVIIGYYEYYKQCLVNVISNKKFVTFTGYYA